MTEPRVALGPPVSTCRLIASARSLESGERVDLLLHALAQLPDDVTLELYASGPHLPRLELLARAYDITERVRFSAGGTPENGQIVHPSLVNLATAPIRGPDALVLDASHGGRAQAEAVQTMAELVERLSWSGAPPSSLRLADELLAGERVVLVTNVPTPYRVELFTRVAKRLEAAGATFNVVYQSHAAKGRPWLTLDQELPFRHHFLRGYEMPIGGRRSVIPLDLEWKLLHLRPTLLISAGFSPLVSGRVARLANRRLIPFGIYSGETRAMPTAGQEWRRGARRWIVNRASFAIAYGFESGEYLFWLRPTLPLVYARNSSLFGRSSRRPVQPNPVRILSTADLNSERKGVDILIDALKYVPELPCELSIVGGGALLGSLRERARGDARVRFLGPLSYEKARSQYGESDIYAFPTRQDVYGLVMVEAMGSGLATVVSKAPGALGDLGVDGTNCLVVATHEPQDWASALEQLVHNHDLRRALAERGRATIIRRWMIDHSADAMIAGLRLGLLAGVRGHA